MSYYGFLKDQEPAFQDSVLGKANAEKLRSGELNIKQFNKLDIYQQFRPITLEELKESQGLVTNIPKG